MSCCCICCWCCRNNHVIEVPSRRESIFSLNSKLNLNRISEESLIPKTEEEIISIEPIDDKTKYVAQFNFDPAEETDLAFKIGDIIIVAENVTDRNSWYNGYNETTKDIGFVPMPYLVPYRSLEKEPWFFKINYYTAENLLMEKDLDKGTFLIRPSRGSDYSLVVRNEPPHEEPAVKHYKIHKDEGGYYITNTLKFATLNNLVKAYLSDKENYLNLCTNITKPCPKIDPIVYELSGGARKNWEIKKEDISMEKVPISKGNSAEVFKGKWKNKLVAVKILTDTNFDKKYFEKELEIMKALRHKNIIAFYGVCSITQPYYILLEFMERGDLLNYVRNNTDIGLQKLQYISCQILEGMQYIELKSMVHRDLAARNILVGAKNTVKIADFGLSVFLRDNKPYQMSSHQALPTRYLAPESFDMNKRIFNNKTDIWTFGILLIEIYSKGARPYYEIEEQINGNNNALFKFIQEGYRMPKPSAMPLDTYEVCIECWEYDPQLRPTFHELNERFLDAYTITYKI